VGKRAGVARRKPINLEVLMRRSAGLVALSLTYKGVSSRSISSSVTNDLYRLLRRSAACRPAGKPVVMDIDFLPR